MSAPTSHSPARRTRHLGVTGGIGSGKSTLAAMLAQQGAVLIDADQISRSLTAAGGAAIAAIRAQFGAALIDADGALDRAQMRALVFSQPSARQQLEAIVHPLIAEHTAAQAQAAQAQGARCVVFDIPLLVESDHWPRQLDTVRGAAARLGRDQTHVLDLVLFQFAPAHLQGMHGARHGRTRQPPRGLQPLSELDRLLKASDNLKVTARRSGNQHPATVCSQIQSRIKRPRIGLAGARRLNLRSRERVRTRGTPGRHVTPSDIKLLPR